MTESAPKIMWLLKPKSLKYAKPFLGSVYVLPSWIDVNQFEDAERFCVTCKPTSEGA